MEVIILICLIIIILLLLSEKVSITVRKATKKREILSLKKTTSIIGLPKQDRQSVPKSDIPSHRDNTLIKDNNFEPLVHDAGLEGGSEEPENTLEPQELLEEERAFTSGSEPFSENEYAQGVSFEELTQIGTLVKKQDLAMDDAKQIIHIARKIDGTQMMDMLGSEMSAVSHKIAALLDKSSVPVPGSSPILFEDFDIAKFL
ncbi:hypothetical protein CMU32_12225 [Elizabethkingia anophelis]|nr:hypothetical protein [Elizabethkingia anophelis]